ncbi:hypothetical protein PUN28_015618 [Cardiocondyla obscurior]|uniref:Uncharacterized protein n=1 Tax=Cardiocondyla obscurior TaxID=286306 RepID=A0AAW2EXL8_9HYME
MRVTTFGNYLGIYEHSIRVVRRRWCAPANIRSALKRVPRRVSTVEHLMHRELPEQSRDELQRVRVHFNVLGFPFYEYQPSVILFNHKSST